MHRQIGAVAVMLVLGVAGCGGAGGGKEISRAAFVAKADAACKLKAQTDRSNASSSGKPAGKLFADATATRHRVLDALNAIQAPDPLKDDFDQYKSVYAARTRVYERVAAAMERGGITDEAAADSTALQAKSTRLHEKLGLQVCP